MIDARRCSAVVAAIAGLAACGGAPHVPVAPPPPAPPLPLTVLLVVDQLPSWSFAARVPLFAHGLARLVREGRVAMRAPYPYAYTLTGAGHAALGTGAPPSVTGIIGNTWYRRDVGRALSAEVDDAVRLFDPAGGGLAPEALGGASAALLEVPGLAESIHAAGDGRAVAIALKSRAACFVAGQRPDVVAFYEEDLGAFTTSTAYAQGLPPWLAALRTSSPASRFDGATWTPGDPAMLARVTGIADAAAGEGGSLGPAFPHTLPTPAGRALLGTPFGDELVVDAALAAVDGEALGQGGAPDLLAVSFSSHDYAGHTWGQESWEVLDLVLRLDAQIGRLLDGLDARLGADRYAVVLTSDHGATPMIDRVPSAKRIAPTAIAAAVDGALDAAVAPGDWVLDVQSLNVYLAPAFAALPMATQHAALAAAATALQPLDVQAGDFAAVCQAAPSPLQARLCASYAPGRSGELYLVPPEGSLITEYNGGTHHDAPSAANREVPIILRVPGLAPGALPDGTTPLQVAPTIAALLGVPAPAAALGAPLVP